jgi:hypothetical protein
MAVHYQARVALILGLLMASSVPKSAHGAPFVYSATLVRCSEATSTGVAVVNVGCGGDTLTSGSINVLPSNGRVAVTLKGASQVRA